MCVCVSIYIKEDELSRSVGSCTQEADVLKTWINFLEDTWVLQSSNTETKEKEVRYVFELGIYVLENFLYYYSSFLSYIVYFKIANIKFVEWFYNYFNALFSGDFNGTIP